MLHVEEIELIGDTFEKLGPKTRDRLFLRDNKYLNRYICL